MKDMKEVDKTLINAEYSELCILLMEFIALFNPTQLIQDDSKKSKFYRKLAGKSITACESSDNSKVSAAAKKVTRKWEKEVEEDKKKKEMKSPAHSTDARRLQGKCSVHEREEG